MAEIFAWVGDWEVDWRVDRVRTVALAYGFDAALPLAGKHEQANNIAIIVIDYWLNIVSIFTITIEYEVANIRP